jgi:uncharacterized membrane protein YjjB (DUF3815 family)
MTAVITEMIYAVAGTVAFSILFSVPRRYYLSCGLIGGAGWLVYSLSGRILPPEGAALSATVIVILLSRIAAVIGRCPATIFMIPGIFPLIPGAGIYWTSYYIVTEQLDLALHTGYEAVKTAVAIVLGILFVFEVPGRFFKVFEREGRK